MHQILILRLKTFPIQLDIPSLLSQPQQPISDSSYVILFYVWLGKGGIRKTSIFSRDQIPGHSFVFRLPESIVGDPCDWLSGAIVDTVSR